VQRDLFHQANSCFSAVLRRPKFIRLRVFCFFFPVLFLYCFSICKCVIIVVKTLIYSYITKNTIFYFLENRLDPAFYLAQYSLHATPSFSNSILPLPPLWFTREWDTEFLSEYLLGYGTGKKEIGESGNV